MNPFTSTVGNNPIQSNLGGVKFYPRNTPRPAPPPRPTVVNVNTPTPTASLAVGPRTGDESCWLNWDILDQQVFRSPVEPALQVGQFQPLHYDNKTRTPLNIPLLVEREQSAYHTKVIPRGEFGEVSKIREELAEVEDAIEQNNPLLILCELADMLGAIEGYSLKHHNISLMELYKMTELTRRAFESGQRK